jgi:hypothetical protein
MHLTCEDFVFCEKSWMEMRDGLEWGPTDLGRDGQTKSGSLRDHQPANQMWFSKPLAFCMHIKVILALFLFSKPLDGLTRAPPPAVRRGGAVEVVSGFEFLVSDG